MPGARVVAHQQRCPAQQGLEGTEIAPSTQVERAALGLRQDGAAAPPLQRGLHSKGFKGLLLAHQERRIRHFHETLDEYLG